MKMKIQIIFKSIPSDQTIADKRYIADAQSVCQHSRKPLLAAWLSPACIKNALTFDKIVNKVYLEVLL